MTGVVSIVLVLFALKLRSSYKLDSFVKIAFKLSKTPGIDFCISSKDLPPFTAAPAELNLFFMVDIKSSAKFFVSVPKPSLVVFICITQ